MGVKRPALLIGGVILVAVGAAGAWLTRVPDTAPRVAKASEANRAAATAASPPTSIVVPQAAAPPCAEHRSPLVPLGLGCRA